MKFLIRLFHRLHRDFNYDLSAAATAVDIGLSEHDYWLTVAGPERAAMFQSN